MLISPFFTTQQVVGGSFAADMVQLSLEHLKTDRDANSRTGYCIALGCIHRYCGMVDSARFLSNSVAILRALAADTSTLVQVGAVVEKGKTST